MRLELGSEGRYGLRALIYLAQIDGRATADTISAEMRMPRRLLARILAKLSHAGLVESYEGRGGGSRLARPPEKIALTAVLIIIDPEFGSRSGRTIPPHLRA